MCASSLSFNRAAVGLRGSRFARGLLTALRGSCSTRGLLFLIALRGSCSSRGLLLFFSFVGDQFQTSAQPDIESRNL